MLQRVSTTFPLNRWQTLRRGLSESQAALLLRYLIVLGIIVLIGSIYFWQVSLIADMEQKIGRLTFEAQELEITNASLSVRSSVWTGPALIESQAEAAGMQPATRSVRVSLPPAGQPISLAEGANQ